MQSIADQILLALADANDQALVMDEFKGALIGTASRFGMDTVALYDRDKIIKILMERDQMTEEEAIEHFDYNIIGTGADNVPVFATVFTEEPCRPPSVLSAASRSKGSGRRARQPAARSAASRDRKRG